MLASFTVLAINACSDGAHASAGTSIILSFAADPNDTDFKMGALMQTHDISYAIGMLAFLCAIGCEPVISPFSARVDSRDDVLVLATSNIACDFAGGPVGPGPFLVKLAP